MLVEIIKKLEGVQNSVSVEKRVFKTLCQLQVITERYAPPIYLQNESPVATIPGSSFARDASSIPML